MYAIDEGLQKINGEMVETFHREVIDGNTKADLANDMAGDEAEFPRRVGIKDRDGHGAIRRYLESCQACDACLDVFEECWKEYAECEKSRSNTNSCRP